MNRKEMLDELLERLESELDELTNAQLTNLISEYEHSPMLNGVVESLNDYEEDVDDENDSEEEELPLIDGDWSDHQEEDE